MGFAGVSVATLGIGFQANAGEKTWDFETDPFDEFPYIASSQEDFVWGGQGWDDWGAEGNPGGFFSISEATGSTATIAVLPDIDNGEFVKAFNMKMDLRMGNGTTDRPADGISINFARSAGPGVDGDPMLADLEGGSASQSNAATSGAAETGTSTGVAVSFDTWAGNSLPDGPDIEGVIVRVDNKTVGRFGMPVRHGSPDDIQSLQTGPIGGSADAPDAERGDPTILSWVPLEVDVNELGILNVNYKNQPLVENFESGFFPSPGQIILMGRTGGANEVHHIDNLTLKTELADEPVITGLQSTADSFSITFRDVGSAKVVADSIAVSLDGEDVTGSLEVSKDGLFTTVTYQSPTIFESASEHVVDVTANTTTGKVLNASPSFTASTYAMVPASLALEGVDTSTPGFLMYVKQSATGRGNNTQARLDHLADDSENIADDWGSEDYVWTVDIVNFDQDGNPQGEFRDSGNGDSQDVPDDFIPGIPGLEGGTDNITAMIETVVRVPDAGFYTFGFNSDDGFLTTAGNDKADAVKLGEFSGGRGASTTPFTVYFEAAGDYAMQSLWYEGGGGANLEWFTIEPNKALLNDTANGGLKTFATKPSVPALVTSVSPSADASGVSPQASISAVIEDADGTVNAGSVSLSIDGVDSGASASKSGGVTTITAANSGMWSPGQVVTATLTYSAGGSSRSVSWSWTVTNYTTLSQGVTPVGSGSDAGFEFRIYQTAAGRGNNTDAAESQLAGLHADGAENVADPSGGSVSNDDARPGIIFNVDGVINMDQDGNPQGVFRDSGDGSTTDRADDFIPGIPGLEGSTDNMAAEILTFIEFPEAGYYTMIFNSDDGFLVSETHGAGDSRGSTLGVFNGGRGASDTTFGFAVAEPGVYPIRAIWYEGGGGANLEWSSIVDGERVLINDTSAGGLKAYRSRSGNPVNLDGPAVLSLDGVPAEGSGLDGRYWQAEPKGVGSLAEVGQGIIDNTRPVGVFTATGLNYQGSTDITPVREWLGDDGASYVGGEGDMNDGLLSFTGYVRIDNPGEVDIRSESDDGSRVWIAGELVVDNDGSHGAPGPTPDGSYNFETPGLYPIEVQWFNGNWTNDAGEHGGANLRVMAGGDDIPGAILYGAADVAAASIAASSAAEEVGDAGLHAAYWTTGPKGMQFGEDAQGNIFSFVPGDDHGLGLMETNPQGRFISTNVNYSGTDISPILEWLGDDAGSFVGTEGELNDGLIQFKGYVAIDEAGLHTFRSASDDGSVVFVGNQVVVNNDGGHGAPGPAPDGSAFFPAAGLYPIEVAWFNGNWTNDAGDHGGANIDLTMDGESLAGSIFQPVGGLPPVSSGGISSVALSEGNVVIEYSGTLKSADVVTGPYSAVDGASSPYSVPAAKAAEFFIAE